MNSSQAPAFRADIQALRGLAILLVLLHHAKLDFLRAGYLGVDIFFVISGYLITQIIRRDLENGVFSFSGFYFRRAKRLLPAAYVTFLVATVLSGIFLTKIELRAFLRQLVGAVTFTGNIALWLQTGYFEGAANLKPLLHVWSLSIEEQYYMLLPAALVLVPRRYWVTGAISVLVSSMVLCFVFAPIKPSATFYLLPTRGWELALGSFGALMRNKAEFRKSISMLFWPAVLALIVIPIFPTGALRPWCDAAIVCTATLVIVLRCHPAFVQSPVLRPLAGLGDFSYSLYLVHWPVFAFANNTYVSPVPAIVNYILIAVAVALGYLLYRCVERPVRQADIKFSRKSLGATLAASFALVLASLVVTTAYSPDTDYTDARRVNHGFGPECEFDSTFHLSAACSNSKTPRILVWGDSIAMHLVPGIVATTDFGVAQATKSVCGPLTGMAPIGEGYYQRPWPETCLQFNQSVFDYLAKADSIEYVVLASQFGYLTSESRVLYAEGGENLEMEGSISVAIKALRETVLKVRSLGKRIVVVAPPPSSGFDVGRCLELKASGKLVFGADDDSCRISTAAYHQHRASTLAFLAMLPSAADVNVVRFDDFLCSAETCETELDGVFIYRDGGHLSHDGSKRLAIRMGLTNLLLSAAR